MDHARYVDFHRSLPLQRRVYKVYRKLRQMPTPVLKVHQRHFKSITEEEKELYKKAEGVKYLMHEAFCMDCESEKFKPHEKHHSTVKDVCEMAEALKIQNIILMHTEDSHVQDRKQLYIEEGCKFFSGNIFVPEDGETITYSIS